MAFWEHEDTHHLAKLADVKTRCPFCGHVVHTFFEHVDIDCEHDMSDEEIAALVEEQDQRRACVLLLNTEENTDG